MAEAEVHLAVRSGNVAWLRRVLERNPALVHNRMLVTGATPLHVACHEGMPAIAQELMRWQAEVNVRDDTEATPLHKAVDFRDDSFLASLFLKRKCLAAAKVLLDNKANVDAKDAHGNTPLHRAAMLGRKEFAELLLLYGADPTTTNEKGYTPLRLAVKHNQRRLVEMLRGFGESGLLAGRSENE